MAFSSGEGGGLKLVREGREACFVGSPGRRGESMGTFETGSVSGCVCGGGGLGEGGYDSSSSSYSSPYALDDAFRLSGDDSLRPKTAIGGFECLSEDGERRARCSTSTRDVAQLSFLCMGVARDEERFLYTRNGVFGTRVVLGPCLSSRVPSLIAAATVSAEDPEDRRGLPDCVLGRGYSLRNGDGNGDTVGGLGDSDEW